ncbi:hypothetical protein A1D19_06340 [Lonepinella koalarum]|nr:hypothetical protein [Lonepinella koalarum]
MSTICVTILFLRYAKMCAHFFSAIYKIPEKLRRIIPFFAIFDYEKITGVMMQFSLNTRAITSQTSDIVEFLIIDAVYISKLR